MKDKDEILEQIQSSKEDFPINFQLLNSKAKYKTIESKAIMIDIKKYQCNVILFNPFFKNISKI
jgi:hypothetical protein